MKNGNKSDIMKKIEKQRNSKVMNLLRWRIMMLFPS